MNHENRPANEPENELEAMELEALEFDPHLDEVEQRLRRARPQPPTLDAATIMRLMDEPNVAQPPLAVETHSDTTPLANAAPSTIQGQPRAAIPRLYRRMATVAASWACGALVGALVMFLAIDRPHPAVAEPGGEAVRAEEQSPAADRETMVAGGETKRRPLETAEGRIAREWNADMLRRIADPGRGISDEPVFRAGMHLVQNNVPRRRDARPYCEISRFDDDAMSEETGSLPLEPPMTRERLLEELSSQTPGHVL
ncbi:MAG TPA: hypothetical protein DD670_00880 [Planctomycetaceae bacterium]|nr:hypothetical protein [Planctomycetaceae bacterium]